MPRNLSTNNQSGVADNTPSPWYLLHVGFATPLRLSTKQKVRYEGNTYNAARLVIDLSPPNPAALIYDDDLSLSPIFLGQSASGLACTVYEVYGDAPFSDSDADIVHSGVCGPSRRRSDGYIELPMLFNKPTFTPKYRVTSAHFNHLPPEGLELHTAAGTFIVRRSRN